MCTCVCVCLCVYKMPEIHLDPGNNAGKRSVIDGFPKWLWVFPLLCHATTPKHRLFAAHRLWGYHGSEHRSALASVELNEFEIRSCCALKSITMFMLKPRFPLTAPSPWDDRDSKAGMFLGESELLWWVTWAERFLGSLAKYSLDYTAI